MQNVKEKHQIVINGRHLMPCEQFLTPCTFEIFLHTCFFKFNFLMYQVLNSFVYLFIYLFIGTFNIVQFLGFLFLIL